MAFGMGILPTKIETINIIGALNKQVTSVIRFKNPFKDSIVVLIHLTKNEEG